FEDAEAELLIAQNAFRKLADAQPSRHRSMLAQCCNSLGALYYQTKQYALSEAAHHEAAQIRQELAEREPGVLAHHIALVQSLNNLAVLHNVVARQAQQAGRDDEAASERDKAMEAYGQAIRTAQRILMEQPRVTAHLQRLGLYYANLGIVQR